MKQTMLLENFINKNKQKIGFKTALEQSIVLFTTIGIMIAALFAVSASEVLAQDSKDLLIIQISEQSNVPQQPDLLEPEQERQYSTPMPVIKGKATGASEVFVIIDGKHNTTAPVSNGEFSSQPFLPLSSGSHTVRVQSHNPDTGAKSISSEEHEFIIIANTSPTLLVPSPDTPIGQDRAWVGGVSVNDSTIIVLVDGLEYTRTNVKNHKSGVGSFGVQLKDLSLGAHTIKAIARDKRGQDSFESEAIIVNILPSTPSPTIMTPVVNADSGVDRPFIVGLVQNDLAVSVVVDGKIEETIDPLPHESGVTSFNWQPDEKLSLGKHTFEVFASDNGKLSNNSNAVIWQVGSTVSDSGIVEGSGEVFGTGGQVPVPPGDSMSVTDDADGDTMVSVVGGDETPLVPDVIKSDGGGDVVVTDGDDKGRIDADDDLIAVADGSDLDDKGQVSQGAVVRDVTKSGPRVNTSLIIGIIILIFLLLSILVWYIQEKKQQLGDKVVDIFREADEHSSTDTLNSQDTPQDIQHKDPPQVVKLPGDDDIDMGDFGHIPGERPSDSVGEKDDSQRRNNDTRRDDLPPPPPPMF